MYKDFGRGFYLTTSKEQARSFAKISAKKAKEKGVISYSEEFAFISFFKMNMNDSIKVFTFETADVDWLHCIVSHRIPMLTLWLTSTFVYNHPKGLKN